MRSVALVDLTVEGLVSMLSGNEALFVGHEGGLNGGGLCLFASTLGGWVLIGALNEGEPGWLASGFCGEDDGLWASA